MICCHRDGHGYPCIDQGPSLGGFNKSEDGRNETDLFGSEGDDEVELEKSNVLLLGPTGLHLPVDRVHIASLCDAASLVGQLRVPLLCARNCHTSEMFVTPVEQCVHMEQCYREDIGSRACCNAAVHVCEFITACTLWEHV